MHCVDILDALTKNFLGTAEEGGDLPPSKGPERHNYNPVTTTLKRQREIVCAKTVQKAWREYVGRRRGLSPEAARAAAIEATAAAHQHHADIAAEAQAEEDRAKAIAEGRDPNTIPALTVKEPSTEPIPPTIVSIAEEDEEENDTEKSKSDGGQETSKEEDSKQGAPAEGELVQVGEPAEPAGEEAAEDSRTVELHPDSGVVA